jgi:hypothetical protein
MVDAPFLVAGRRPVGPGRTDLIDRGTVRAAGLWLEIVNVDLDGHRPSRHVVPVMSEGVPEPVCMHSPDARLICATLRFALPWSRAGRDSNPRPSDP